MKTKLLIKAKRKVRLYKRNNTYYVDIGCLISEFKNKQSALNYYRIWVIRKAENIFGFKPKQRLF